MSSQDAESAPSETETTIPTDPIALNDLVRKQVEYYFSRENLQNDSFLTSQMDSQNSVPISIVMQFAKLKALTQDEELVKTALGSSKVVSVVDERIKSSVKPGGRNTIILRDIPADTPEEEVRDVFRFDSCKSIVSLRSDIENTWFVVLETEQDAKDTILDLKLKKRTFRGESVKARLKSETITRSFYMIPPPMPTPFAPMGYPAYLPPTGIFPGYINQSGGMPMPLPVPLIPGMGLPTAMGMGNDVSGHGATLNGDEGEALEKEKSSSQSQSASQSAPSSPAGKEKGDKKGGHASDKGSSGTQSSHGNRSGSGTGTGISGPHPRDIRDRDRKTNSNSASQGQTQQGAGREGARGRESSRDGKKVGGRGKDDRDGSKDDAGSSKSNSTAANTRAITVNAANFPPLGSTESTPIPTPGYKGEYAKYSFDAIINVVKEIKDATLPDSIHPELHPSAMETAPNRDLLKRQRTFSIDETREQLQQGRPVHREAVLGGAVDYASMMYGDGYQDREASEGSTPKAPAASAPIPDKKPAGGSWAGVLMSGVTAAAEPVQLAGAKTTAAVKKVAGKEKTGGASGGGGGPPHKGKDKDGAGGSVDRKHGQGQQQDGFKGRDGRKESGGPSGGHGHGHNHRRGGGSGSAGGVKEKEGGGSQNKAKDAVPEVSSPTDDAHIVEGAAAVSSAVVGSETAVAAAVVVVVDTVESASNHVHVPRGKDKEREKGQEEVRDKHRVDVKKHGKNEAVGGVAGGGGGGPKREKDKAEYGEAGEKKDSGVSSGGAGDKGKDKAAGPTSWMGRPTFANVLKQKQSDALNKENDTHGSEGGSSGMEVLERREQQSSNKPPPPSHETANSTGKQPTDHT